jgi:hypothetical protein
VPGFGIRYDRDFGLVCTPAKAAAEPIFGQQSGRIIPTLIRISGSFDLAEEAMQDAFASALVHWPVAGIPDNPASSITTAVQPAKPPKPATAPSRSPATRRANLPPPSLSVHLPEP